MFSFHDRFVVDLPLEEALTAMRAYQEGVSHTYAFSEDPEAPGIFTGERRADRPKITGHAVDVTTMSAREDGKTDVIMDVVVTGPMGVKPLRRPVSWKLRKFNRAWAETLPFWLQKEDNAASS
jgi:hypothetical protein